MRKIRELEEMQVEYDSGFYFGKGLFETILVLDRPVFLDEHLDRLNSGLSYLGINNNINKADVMENLKNYQNCAVKIMVSEKNVLLSERKLTYTEAQYEQGFKLKLSNFKRNAYSSVVSLKSFNYLENILEKERASKQGYDEVIFLNTDNFLSEGSMSNVFLVMNNCILTPSIDCGILNGIVRSFIIKQLGNKYNIIEDKLSLSEIEKCNGMFITNSLMGLMWVNSFNGINFVKPVVYDEIREFYEKSIGKKF